MQAKLKKAQNNLRKHIQKKNASPDALSLMLQPLVSTVLKSTQQVTRVCSRTTAQLESASGIW
jgi:hypothetical protein